MSTSRPAGACGPAACAWVMLLAGVRLATAASGASGPEAGDAAGGSAPPARPAVLEVRRNYAPRYLFLYGLLDEAYAVADVLRTIRYHLPAPDVCYYAYDAERAGQVQGFPRDYEKLLSYDCVLLGGVSRAGLTAVGVTMLHDYLAAGGSMVVLGSHGAYGRSQLRDTDMGRALPVEIAADPFDLLDTGGRPVRMGPDPIPFLRDVSLGSAATCYFLHRARVRPGAKVVMSVDGAPLMVVGEYGEKRARIICILGAPMGTPGPGQVPFWQDECWPVVLHHAITWAGPWPGIRGDFD